MTPDTLLLALRFLRYTLAMLGWGAGLYVAFIAPAGEAMRLKAQLRLLPGIVAVTLAALTALRLPLLAASFGSGWRDGLQVDAVAATLGTWTGIGWVVDATLCLLLVATAWTAPLRWSAPVLFAGFILVASVLTGHAGIGNGIWAPLHQTIDAAHLLAAGFWLGALLPLLLTLRREGASRDAVTAVQRFGIAGQAAVAVLLATGIANAILIKRGAPFRWSSTYDVLLLLKIGAVIGMIAIASYNRLVLLPRLAARSNGSARDLRHTAVLEIILGLGAVGFVSVLGTLDPA